MQRMRKDFSNNADKKVNRWRNCELTDKPALFAVPHQMLTQASSFQRIVNNTYGQVKNIKIRIFAKEQSSLLSCPMRWSSQIRLGIN